MKPSILVVEDDETISYILDFMLKREGYEVTTAADGLEALSVIRTPPETDMMSHPDIVLLDIMLPNIDGLQLITEIRNTPHWRNVPIIMLTAKSQETSVLKALEAGANDYITKPFLPAEVLARVKKFVKS